MFRHSSLYVRRNGTVREAADLKGKRIGIPEWAQTAGIYTRGMLADQFGVALADVEWVQAGIHEAGREEEVVVNPPAGVTLARVADRTLNDMLLSGEIDAMMSAHPPRCFESGDPRVRRLFEDFMSVEHRYWQDTGVFPIMHTILLGREVYEKYRWIAMNLAGGIRRGEGTQHGTPPRCYSRAVSGPLVIRIHSPDRGNLWRRLLALRDRSQSNDAFDVSQICTSAGRHDSPARSR